MRQVEGESNGSRGLSERSEFRRLEFDSPFTCRHPDNLFMDTRK